ncbi:FecR family protein [Pedobacter punctiformis]|uniref:FecR family protein n=1 Tax=Pedobacter punctiformis TaxID=3004097 RepID=A0ABT4L6T3_9SPHI|nr:FecR family protein [Pedobacter sp. HCMS5-2]MCZ4243630.1 FecR family protein [Pedobacter sp. HCMS5-2]
MNTKELQRLLKKYNNKTATPEEKQMLEAWYETINGQGAESTAEETVQLKNEIFGQIKSKIASKQVQPASKSRVKVLSLLFAKAAILLAIFSAGIFFYLKRTDSNLYTSIVKRQKTTIKPGGNNAVLTLADGSTIILNQAADGQIGNQSGVSITKTKSGELVYTFAGNVNAKNTEINTVSTPKGGQYHLILIDGTHVWLNANSSIKFPAAFAGNDRKVEVTGEVYFEVFKNKMKPFIVNTSQSEIKVLGTHFNVNAYDDEAFERTTLLEGSVELKRGPEKTILTPGKQASIAKSSSHIKISDIDDLEAIIAWKNGYFQFDHADLQSVMRQVSRWYNVNVSYKGSVLNKEYSGKIPRKTTAEKLVEMLHYSGIKCKIENNQITVNP